MKKTLIVAVALGISAGSFAAETEVFQWKDRRGRNTYSDTPRGMKMGQSNVLNIRTKTVTPPATATATTAIDPNLSLAEQQAQLNQRIAEENKKNQEAVAKQQEDIKAENCKTARMNREMVDRSNARNKADLIPRYDADISKYCN